MRKNKLTQFSPKRFDEAADDLRSVFGQRRQFPVKNQRDENVLLVRFQHDVRDSHRGSRDRDLEKVNRSLESLVNKRAGRRRVRKGVTRVIQ